MTYTAENIKWNLSDLYESPESQILQEDLKKASHAADRFETTYKTNLTNLLVDSSTVVDFAKLFKDYEEILRLITKPIVYAHLRFAEQTDDASRGAFLHNLNDKWTEIHSKLIFWEVLFNKLSDLQIEKIKSLPELKSKLHYIDSVRKYAPHTLSESEEKILSATASVSGSAFARLFDETVNSIAFKWLENGQDTTKTESQILALLHSPEREVRKKASQSLSQGLSENAKLITYIYNMVLADHRVRSKIRGYAHPSQSRNMANETDFAAVSNLIDSCVRFYPEVEKYYRLKTRLLGIDQMQDYDRYAPLSDADEKISFEECRQMVIDSYADFDPECGNIAQRFFDERWIDAEMRSGKRGGGFCCSVTPDHHPFILVNYSGSLRDVLTVAHEVGHGIHQFLSRKVGILECDAPLTMAETASVFGEMLTFDRLLKRVESPRDRLALRCGQIDDQIATIFRQIAMTRYELQSHEAGLKKGELSELDFNQFWMNVNQELYGKSVQLSESYRHGWKYIPHFIHTPFYCYAYSFAQLFVLALFAKYKDGLPGFVDKYKQILSLGGSEKPENIAQIMGVNLTDKSFWNSGLTLFQKMVDETIELAGQVQVKK